MGDSPDVRKFLTDIGRRGGQARAKALSADQRKAIARKGAKASAKARRQKAKKKSWAPMAITTHYPPKPCVGWGRSRRP